MWERSNLLGDAGGWRPALANAGITIGLSDTEEVLGNVTGGVHTGAAYDAVTQFGIGLDTLKTFGWKGGTFNISGLQIRGRSLSSDNLFVLQSVSGLEAADTTRLWELWYQQMLPSGKADIKLGLQSVDQEFMLSNASSIFLNTALSWPMVPTENLYAGGPAYPLSSLAIRLRLLPSEVVTMLAGVFDDNPPGGPFDDDSQLRGASRWGGNFSLRTGALFIAEIQYTTNTPAPGDRPDTAERRGLPGTYKIGFWYDTGPFPSQQFATNGVSLASPTSTGVPELISHNFGIYGVVDQTVWKPSPKGARELSIFLRMAGAPGDRNLLGYSADWGVTLKAPFPGRDQDILGIGFGLVHVSGSVAALDRAMAAFTGAFVPVRTNETVIELTYQAQLTGWSVLQPDIQYVLNPGGGLANSLQPGKRIGNELVLGLRSVVTF